MTHYSSYPVPRSGRPSDSYSGQRGRDSKRNIYSKRSWKDDKTLFALVCLILPFITISPVVLFLAVSTPKINYTIPGTQDYKTVDLSIKIRSLPPLGGVTVTLETKPVELVEEKGACKITLEGDGALEVQMAGWNGMTKRAYEHIVTLDDAPPSIDKDDYVIEGGQLTVIASDSQSDVNYGTAYAVDEKEGTTKPMSTNKDTGKIASVMDTSSLTTYIEDFADNIFKTSFMNRIEGIDTSSRDSKFPSDDTNGTNGSGNSSDSNTSSSGTKGTTRAKEITKVTKATEKAEETIKAAKATEKAKETTKATKATEKTTQAAKATSAVDTMKATEASKPVESTTASTTSPTTTPITPTAPGPGEGSSPIRAPTQASQVVPDGDSDDVIIVPIT